MLGSTFQCSALLQLTERSAWQHFSVLRCALQFRLACCKAYNSLGSERRHFYDDRCTSDMQCAGANVSHHCSLAQRITVSNIVRNDPRSNGSLSTLHLHTVKICTQFDFLQPTHLVGPCPANEMHWLALANEEAVPMVPKPAEHNHDARNRTVRQTSKDNSCTAAWTVQQLWRRQPIHFWPDSLACAAV